MNKNQELKKKASRDPIRAVDKNKGGRRGQMKMKGATGRETDAVFLQERTAQGFALQ